MRVLQSLFCEIENLNLGTGQHYALSRDMVKQKIQKREKAILVQQVTFLHGESWRRHLSNFLSYDTSLHQL